MTPAADRMAVGDEEAFRELADAFRGELQMHCYRIVGSVQDAEDLVQETLLAAWRGLNGFEGRASLRSWLYRIATNRCLNALRDRGRRPPELPPAPAEAPAPPEPTRHREPIWLEPYPDALLEGVDRSREPHARYEAREAIGLAFVAGLQRLPPRQRAVLVLRDALGFRAAEVAETLGTTEASVTSALHRARSALDADVHVVHRDDVPLPNSRAERDVVTRFTDAFEGGDVDGVVALLTEDARLTMPPAPLEYQGADVIARFLTTAPAGGRLDLFRLVPTRANGQPAFGCYVRDPHTPIAHAYGLMVLTLRGGHVAAITGFPDTSVFPHFGLPRTLRSKRDHGIRRKLAAECASSWPTGRMSRSDVMVGARTGRSAAESHASAGELACERAARNTSENALSRTCARLRTASGRGPCRTTRRILGTCSAP